MKRFGACWPGGDSRRHAQRPVHAVRSGGGHDRLRTRGPILSLLGALLLVMAFPELSLWLPRQLGYG
ncbi:MAG: hypothetical protein IPK63_20120 [Candidatus Competibacteraceae bacterium]|nr:hypothetical protein [Candidatus Competibacteraceae bacterium]